MKTRIDHKAIWSTIYSLGLLPLILLWGFAPALNDFTIATGSLLVGVVWLELSRRMIGLPQGCGIIGWATALGMVIGGAIQLALLFCGILHTPIVLFVAPVVLFLLYRFRNRNKKTSFCHQCIAQRGGAEERKLVGDFSRYEVRYITGMVIHGCLLVTLLSWGLFIYGIEPESSAGDYFYCYFPLALCLATLFFEIIRRILLHVFFDMHDRKSQEWVTKNDEKQEICYTAIRIVAICQGEIYLTQTYEENLDEIEVEAGLDSPFVQFHPFCLSHDEEREYAFKSARHYWTDRLNLYHLSTITSPTHLRRVGQYLLLLPHEEKSKLDQYGGRWYSVEELNQLFHDDKLHPIFKEFYARLYTIINTVRTYCPNGKRRVPIKGYNPPFTLHDLDKLKIEFDDPIWSYVSRYNEDKILYRLNKLFNKCKKKRRHHD